MSARLSALLVWGLVAAATVFWILRLSASSPTVPPGATVAVTGVPSGADLGRLLGVRAPVTTAAAPVVSPDLAARFKLTGVIAAGRREGAGLALISVDGKPPRAYRVGQRVDPQLVLQSVALRSARIAGADGTLALTLELPPPTPPAIGTLAAVGLSSLQPAPPDTALPAGNAAPGLASINTMSAPAAMPAPPPGAVDQANEEARMRAQAR